MDPMYFAHDASFTPVSILRQKAKALVKSEGIKLHEALNTLAHDFGIDTWEELMEEAWALQPEPVSYTRQYISTRLTASPMKIYDGNARDKFLMRVIIHQEENATFEIYFPEEGKLTRVFIQKSYDVEGSIIRILFGGNEIEGYPLEKIGTTPEEIEQLSKGTLTSKARDIIHFANSVTDDTPYLEGPFVSDESREMKEVHSEANECLSVAVEVPDSKEVLGIDIPLSKPLSEFRAQLKPAEDHVLFQFTFRTDGSLKLSRSKVSSREQAAQVLREAGRYLTFLDRTGLRHMVRKEIDSRSLSDDGYCDSKALDHVRHFIDADTGVQVLLNQPYHYPSQGLIPMLARGTKFRDAPPWASLHGHGTNCLFIAKTAGDVDLTRITEGAAEAASLYRSLEISYITKPVATAKPEKQKSARKKGFISPVMDIELDLSNILIQEKSLLHRSLPDIAKLQTPYWKQKMKAYTGKEPLSWEMQDKEASEGLNITDLIDAIKKCPLDADLWGMLAIFDISDVTKAEVYRRGVIAGELFLGRMMTDEVGSFWGVLETRPYMRCMNLLYRQLVMMERPKDAAPIGRKMLELCPNDNIGIRFTLDEVEAACDDPARAEDLANAFADDDAMHG